MTKKSKPISYSNYITWVKTSWTYSKPNLPSNKFASENVFGIYLQVLDYREHPMGEGIQHSPKVGTRFIFFEFDDNETMRRFYFVLTQ